MMKKVLPFLEMHVQWIALGLGALYLGYMIWGYVVQTPVMVTSIAPTPLTPGEVDEYILKTVAQPLATAMNDTHVPDMKVPNFIDRFKADMGFTDFAAYALDIIPDSPVLGIMVSRKTDKTFQPDAPIKALPTLPAAAFVDSTSGKSNVTPFTPAAGGAAGAVGNNGAQPVGAASDKSWITVSFTISPSAMAKAFQAASIPSYTEHTTILDVQLWRQEAQPGGKWSDPPILIKPINSDALLAYPPANNGQLQQTYLAWAKLHVGDILQPGFYAVNKGDQWHAPGQIIAAAAPVALTPLDPTQDYPLSVIQQYPEDQKHAYFLAHNKFKQSQRGQGRRNSAPPPPPDAGGSSRRNSGGAGAEVFADNIQPPAAIPGTPAGAPDPNAPAVAPPDLSTQFPIPPGDFDPNSVPADIVGWAHDDTVVPGHTYRYMITYRIKNPIEGTNAAKNNPALTQIFEIQSPPGVWSKPINVASTTNFFVYANSRPGSTTAKIKVYKWQNGLEKSHTFDVSPGDIIGGKDGDVDYNTGWTVVDLRFDDPKNPESMTILVMDPNGIIDRRDYRTDQAKPELKALDLQVSSSSAPDQLAGGR